MMERPNEVFEERLTEIEEYLSFLQAIEEQARSGPPRLEGSTTPISAQQQRILYSSVYLQLYNLVESTITRCIDAVARSASESNTWQPSDLSVELRREWVRVVARTHIDLNYENRLQQALALCEHLVAALPISDFKIEKGGGGNWDVSAIEKISDRLGFQLQISQPIYRAVKQAFKDDMGPLELVKQLRNRLAHGEISFSECGEGVSVSELRDLKDKTANYLREVVSCFSSYIDDYMFLHPERRPGGVA